MSIPLRIVTGTEMREIDRVAEQEHLIDAQVLMENAGRETIQVLFDQYPGAGRETEILVFAGKGNNAGDAFVVARRLICMDRRVRIFYLAPPANYQGAAKKNFEILQRLKAKMSQVETMADLEAFFRSFSGPFTIIDGILGTGLKGNLEGIYYDTVHLINKQNIDQVLSLDIPSGVNGDTGTIHGAAIHATLTVSFGFPKIGHFLAPGAARRGDLVNVDISLPPKFRKQGDKFLLSRNQLAPLVRTRDRYGHKNSFGSALLIGGSLGRLGAICMSASACHKMGTGLVTVATWKSSVAALMAKLSDESMAFATGIDEVDPGSYEKLLSVYSSIVMGPGFGLQPEGKGLMEYLLSVYRGPLVLDADALNLISDHKMHELVSKRRAPTVLTPHPGEMARLLGIAKDQVLENPIAAVRDCVNKTHSIVVLKGPATFIGSTDDVIYINHYPNDGMATAGSGDVLAGMVGGLIGQKLEPFKATQLAVYLHSLAGDYAAKTFGPRSMTAPDIIGNIGNAFKDLAEFREPSFPEEGRARLH